MEFMTLYFNGLKNPVLPFRFAPLGLKLMRKGKVHPQIPTKGKGFLNAIFRKAQELEEAS
jgi:heterodisulfide reductase subunit C